MSVIINYNSDQKDKLIKYWKKHICINDDTEIEREGLLYLIDHDLYKVYFKEPLIEERICRDDLYLESFIFPTEIYTHNGRIFGYKTPYIEKNLLNYRSLKNGWNFDLVKFKKALDQLIFDTFVLSKNHISAIDFVLRNTLYDGKRFYIIDTLDYQLVEEDTLPENIERLKSVIRCFILDYNLAIDLRYIQKDEDTYNEVNVLLKYIDNKFKELEETYKDEDIKKMRG